MTLADGTPQPSTGSSTYKQLTARNKSIQRKSREVKFLEDVAHTHAGGLAKNWIVFMNYFLNNRLRLIYLRERKRKVQQDEFNSRIVNKL